MHDFDYDCRIKKSIASNARRMRNGSKSRKCSLSTDNMTQAQWKKKNGKVISMNLSKPMAYHELKEIPIDLQKEYIHRMIDKFGCSMAVFATFFGVNPMTISKYFDKIGIDKTKFKRGARMTKAQEIEFRRWSDGEHIIAEDAKKEESVPIERLMIPKEPAVKVQLTPVAAANTMTMSHVEMTFEGNFDAEQIANTLRYMVDGKVVRVKLIVDEVRDDG